MIKAPISHFFDWSACDATSRRIALREFAANGARHVVLGHSLMYDILRDPTLIDALLDDARAAGLTWLDSHAPFGGAEDLVLPVAARRPFMIARYQATLHAAAAMNVERCVIHVGNPTDRSVSVEQYLGFAAEALDALLPVAEAVGVTLCIENVWSPTCSVEALLGLVEKFPSERLGICYDAGHAHIVASRREDGWGPPAWEGYGPMVWRDDTLEALLPHMVTCHLHDNDGASDQHLPPGQGTIDWSREMKLLARAPRLESLQNETSFGRCDGTIAGACAIFTQLAAMPSAGGV